MYTDRDVFIEIANIVKEIMSNEQWFEGERRNSPIDPNDPTVLEKVLTICQFNGRIIREEAIKRLTARN